MALTPNRFEETTFPAGPSGTEAVEGRGTVTIRSGYHDNPTDTSDSILIESTKTVLNEYGTQIRRDEERWSYDIHGGPPVEYNRRVYSNVYLPGIGRNPERIVEEERVFYWPFTPLTTGDNLGKTRVVSGYVIYDKPVIETPLTAEQVATMIEAGTYPLSVTDRVVQSGKLWSDANLSSAIVPQQDAAQYAKWVDSFIIEEDVVEEEADKWTVWKVKKNGLRSAGVEWEGPTEIRKTGHSYVFPYPIKPPKLTAINAGDGIKLEVKGGGASIKNAFFHETFNIAPEKYNIYRRTISEPDREADDDLYNWWDTPPAKEIRKILENTAVVDEDGNPISPLPAAIGYTEPEDPEPEDPPPDTSFRLIATVTNSKGKKERGYAEHKDTDVEDTATYEYFATAVISSKESPDSNHERITFSGTGNRSYRIVKTDDGYDAIAPDDPALGEYDEGDVIDFDLPTYDEEIITEVADRAFTQKEPDVQITVTILHPVFGLEWGMGVKLPAVAWETFAPGYHISTQTEDDRWMLSGFTRRSQRTADGKWETPRTEIRMQQRPDPS